MTHLDYTWEKREPLIRKEEYERGIEAGKEQGLEQGLERGLKQGLERGIMALITSCKEFEVSFEETRKKIQEKFSMAGTRHSKKCRYRLSKVF